MRRAGRRLRPPRTLAALLGIVTVIGLCWALTVPPFQTPDEPAHYAYSESLAQGIGLPGIVGRESSSTEQNTAEGAAGSALTAFHPDSAPPPWSASAESGYLQADRSGTSPSRTDGAGPSSASQNPPLYYLYADVAYLVDDSGTTFGRLYGMRISGVVLLLLTTLAAWLLAGETFGRRRLPQLVTAATAALLPMSSFMSTSVNPDAGLIPTWTTALWLGARVINRRAKVTDAAALCAVTAAAILTKSTSYALTVPAVVALGIGWGRRERGPTRPALLRMAAALSLLVGPIIGWLALNRALHRAAINQVGSGTHAGSVGQFVSYVWQFYLPKLWFMSPIRATRGLPLHAIWIGQGTGAFGWLDVALPSWMYTVSEALLAALSVAVVVLATRLRKRLSLGLLGFYASALVALLGLLHVTEYRVLLSGGGQFLQGRYLLPVVGLLGLAVGWVVTRVPVHARAAVTGLALVGLLAAQVISLTSILHAYYV